MDENQADLLDIHYFLETARNTPAWVRAFVDRRSGQPCVSYLDVFVGPQPDDWRGDEVWIYPSCVFTAKQLPVEDLTVMLFSAVTPAVPDKASGAQAQIDTVLDIGWESAALGFKIQSYRWQHQPSMANLDKHRCPWPTLSFEVAIHTPEQYGPNGFLVGEHAPSFPMFSGAFSAFFYGDFTVTGTQSPSLGTFSLRFADCRGRFRSVRVPPTSLDISLEGTCSNLVLELNSATQQASVPASTETAISIPTPDGPPNDAWLWLKSGDEWLDYRSVTGWPTYHSAGVEFMVPEDPGAELSSLIAQGEGPRLEFKSKVPDKRDKEAKRHMFKTIAAFASRQGGIMLIGVEDRTGVVLGLGDDPETERGRFTTFIRTLVTPTPNFTATTHVLDEKSILVVEIEPSPRTIHALTVDADKPEFYVRRGATTFHARSEEIAAIFAVDQHRIPQGLPFQSEYLA